MKSSFFNSVNYDRTYSAKDWAEYFKQFIGNGVYAEPDTGMQIVSDGGMNVKCLDGSCFINGYTGTASSTEDKRTLAIGDGVHDRIDAIVARLDLNKRDIHIDVIQGVPSATPAKPKHVRTKMVHDLVLAYVTVKAKAMSISDANIEDVRPNEAVCGFVKGVVEQIKTGELFKQYAKEWELLMAGAKLDEPAIIAAFNALNSVRSVNGITPVDGNILLPQLKIMAGTYTGNGAVYAETIDYSDYPVFSPAVLPVKYPQALTQDQVTKNIGATPSVVMIAKRTDGNIDAENQYIITSTSKYLGSWTKANVKNTQECYVIQKDGIKFDGTTNECITGGLYKYDPYRYYFYLDNGATSELVSPEYLTKLIVVSDDVTPASNQIRRSDLQDKLLINELIGVDESGNPDGIEGVEKKRVDDVVIGQTVYKTILNQKHYYKYRTASKIIENGFITNFNSSGTVYNYIAFAEIEGGGGGGLAITNPNLLINPDFKINQRGKTEYNGTNPTYSVDRWYSSNANLTIKVCDTEEGGRYINLSTTEDTTVSNGRGYFRQNLGEALSGKYTLSADVRGSGVYLLSLFGPDANTASKIYTATENWTRVSVTVDASNNLNVGTTGNTTINAFYIRLEPNSSIDFRNIKLERGSVATQFTAPDPATELAKCQRYFYAISFGSERFIGNGGSNGTGHVVLSLPTTMRIAPTISNSDGSETKLIIINGNTTISDVTITQVYQGQNNISVAINGTGIANGQVLCGYHQRTDDGSALAMYISAEL